jgi:hypothetical protein
VPRVFGEKSNSAAHDTSGIGRERTLLFGESSLSLNHL